MEVQSVSVLRVVVFKNSGESFLSALDEAGINHETVKQFSSQPQMSGITEAITALSEAMPWNSIAKIIVAWINARKSREVMITTSEGKIFHAKGYSSKEVKSLLQESVSIAIIDTQPSNET